MRFSAHWASARFPCLCVLVLGVVLTGALAGCGAPTSTVTTLSLATYLPITGPDAGVGLALQRGIDLAVKENATLGHGYQLSVTHFDATAADPATVAKTITGTPLTLGVMASSTGTGLQTMLPTLAQADLLTLSLGALPSALASPAPAAGTSTAGSATSASLPKTILLRLAASDETAGATAAGVALSSQTSHGLGVSSVYVVSDGSAYGTATAHAFVQQLTAHGGHVVGQQTLKLASPTSAQTITSAIVGAYPNAVFYAGSVAGGATMRGTLMLSGAGALPFLMAGPGVDDADWSTLVGGSLVGGNTVGISDEPPLPTSAVATSFTKAFASAYPQQPLVPQSALGYDAAMDQINAIKFLIAAGQTPTRTAILAAVASGNYAGITGTLAFNSTGTLTTPRGWSIYSINSKGQWQFVAGL